MCYVCYLNQHITQRKIEHKGGGANVQENEVKYLLCVQMQETHLIHTFRRLTGPCGEPEQHFHSLSALGLTAASLRAAVCQSHARARSFDAQPRGSDFLGLLGDVM